MAVQSVHLYRSNSYPFQPRRVTWLKTKIGGVKSGSSGAHKLDKLGLSYEARSCRGAGTGDLGVLPTHETSHMNMATLRRLHQATASSGSDALAPPGSFG